VARKARSELAARAAAPVLPLASKLVALAKEQQEALVRGTTGQFDWLALRRDEVTAQLQQLATAAPLLAAEHATEIERLRHELQRIDGESQTFIREQLNQVRTTRGAVRRFQRAVSPYLTAGPRVPSFVDKTN